MITPNGIAGDFSSLEPEAAAECFRLIINDLHKDGLLIDFLLILDKSTQDILSDAVSNSIA